MSVLQKFCVFLIYPLGLVGKNCVIRQLSEEFFSFWRQSARSGEYGRILISPKPILATALSWRKRTPSRILSRGFFLWKSYEITSWPSESTENATSAADGILNLSGGRGQRNRPSYHRYLHLIFTCHVIFRICIFLKAKTSASIARRAIIFNACGTDEAWEPYNRFFFRFFFSGYSICPLVVWW